MKKYFLFCGWRFTWFLVTTHLFAQVVTAPRLSLRGLDTGELELSWPRSAFGVVPEETDTLSNPTTWQALELSPMVHKDRYVVTLTAGAVPRFIRLRQELTKLSASSPMNGETGIAVTRETIVHFNAPLASDTVLGTNHFYAGYGGRRLLTRVELASDRMKATLFYLEPLPGSTRITAVFDGTALHDTTGTEVDADGNGVPGGQAIIAFDTLSLTPLVNTAVIGTVFASELIPGNDTGTNAVNRPLSGVTITVDGMEQSLRAVTDTNGKFTLSPVPPGRFFVHIDGRTAVNAAAGIRYPDQAYYPYVGKAWDAVAGVTNNLAGGTGTIFLPLITAGTLQPVSLTRDTTITFSPTVVASNPALAGVSITVPANSLFADDGTRGGKVGIAPVPPDRLPGPLPPGAELPLVITVQTDGGLNFDRPVPICFPNLPNPTTKKAWPAGTKGSLISFNHKKGVWEDVGPMTVSADGRFFCTDPGVGILQPGWHGPQSPIVVKAPPPGEEKCRYRLGPFDDPGHLLAQLCVLTAVANYENCRDRYKNLYFTEFERCKAIPGDLVRTGCFADALDRARAQKFLCGFGHDVAVDRCLKCLPPEIILTSPTSVGRRTSGLASPGDAIDAQLDLVFEQVLALLSPFVSAGIPIPPAVQAQAEDLHEKATVSV